MNYTVPFVDSYDIAANAPVGELILGRLTPPNAPIDDLIAEKVNTYHLNYKMIKQIGKTIECETAHTFSPNIQSSARRPDGSREQSFGLAQIFAEAHKEISMEQMTDMNFSIDFMAKNWTEHKGWWSCARILGYTQ